MDKNQLDLLVKEFFLGKYRKGVNHFFSSDFYAWLRNVKNIEVTAEIRKLFRENVAESTILGTDKTAYKSNKTYIFFKKVGLKIRSYVSKAWKPIYDKLKNLYEQRAPKIERWKLWEKIQKCSFPGKTDKDVRLILATCKMYT